MEYEETDPVYPRRTDSPRNMRRFYAPAIQPTLFGGASVVRNWDRIGMNGRSMMETFDGPEAAASAFDRLARTKKRRGYREPDANGCD